jgi:6-pyruvoyltetrahydropterin/6-carboxytetrahydropterin synthase
MYSVTKQFQFCAAHRLHDYIGKCNSLHGHNYRIEISLEAMELDKDMVVDFGKISDIIGRWINDNLDHAILISTKDTMLNNSKFLDNFICKHFMMNDKTTAEHIAELIFNQCRVLINREGLFIRKVTVWETDTCCASFS